MHKALISTDTQFPVILVSNTDFITPQTGKLHSDLSVKFYLLGATSLTTYSLAAGDWKEAGEGAYSIRMGASEFPSSGVYEVMVSCTGCQTYRFWVTVTEKDSEKILLAYTTGRFKVDFPSAGDITFYEQDNTTVLYTMHVTETERTRV